MIDFYSFYKKIPGGILLVPMFVVAIINTIFPSFWASFGGMSTALFKSGTLAFAALILFATGATINVKTLGTVLKRSGALAIVKLAISFAFGILFVRVFGLNGIFGINAVSFVTCICSCNPGVFMGLMQDYGEPADMGNFATMNILTMPCLPIMVLAAASGGAFNIMDIITVLFPFFLGMLMGNLDPKMSKIYAGCTPIVLPFMGCCFGASINLLIALKAGLAGIILSIIYLVIHLLIMLPTDRIINRRPGYASVAMCSVAGIAMTVPSLLSATEYGVYTSAAIPQIALCLIITSVASPFITKAVVAKWGCSKTDMKAESLSI